MHCPSARPVYPRQNDRNDIEVIDASEVSEYRLEGKLRCGVQGLNIRTRGCELSNGSHNHHPAPWVRVTNRANESGSETDVGFNNCIEFVRIGSGSRRPARCIAAPRLPAVSHRTAALSIGDPHHGGVIPWIGAGPRANDPAATMADHLVTCHPKLPHNACPNESRGTRNHYPHEPEPELALSAIIMPFPPHRRGFHR